MKPDDQRPPAVVLFDDVGPDCEKAFAHAPARCRRDGTPGH
ncbi:hypothetical protein ACFYVK_14005 [Streptomyces chartreusis]